MLSNDIGLEIHGYHLMESHWSCERLKKISQELHVSWRMISRQLDHSLKFCGSKLCFGGANQLHRIDGKSRSKLQVCENLIKKTTRNIWPLCFPTRVLPPSTKLGFTKGTYTFFLPWNKMLFFILCYFVLFSIILFIFNVTVRIKLA